MSAETSRLRWKGPAAIWALMRLIAAAIIFGGLSPRGDAQFELDMAGSACLVALLAAGLVGVAKLNPLERLVASAGWMFIALLLMLSLADLLTRRS